MALLGRALFVQRETAVVRRRVEPAPTLGVGRLVTRHLTLGGGARLVGEGVEPERGGLAHPVGELTTRGHAPECSALALRVAELSPPSEGITADPSGVRMTTPTDQR